MRIFLLRALIGWWMVIASWVLLLPLYYLLTGSKKTTLEILSLIQNMYWNGDPDASR